MKRLRPNGLKIRWTRAPMPPSVTFRFGEALKPTREAPIRLSLRAGSVLPGGQRINRGQRPRLQQRVFLSLQLLEGP